VTVRAVDINIKTCVDCGISCSSLHEGHYFAGQCGPLWSILSNSIAERAGITRAMFACKSLRVFFHG
jgi:hypothetical protein